MTTTIQKVRELQEQIRASEAKLLELTQQPEYVAEQAFIQDVMDVLEMHGRTLREAVLAIDPAMIATAAKEKVKRPYAARKPKDVPPFKLTDEKTGGGPPAPKPSPFSTFGATPAPVQNGADSLAEHPLEPEAKKPANPPKRAKKKNGNAKRNAERRVNLINEGRWYLYTNPHTGETSEASRQDNDTLRAWAAEFGKVVVEGWKRPITADEAGIA